MILLLIAYIINVGFLCNYKYKKKKKMFVHYYYSLALDEFGFILDDTTRSIVVGACLTISGIFATMLWDGGKLFKIQIIILQ